ncbi:hypothetical protein FIV34_16660 [Luteibacter pinisoli]|uniref:Uncharacterized protein n=1 Tax=Luteibacter pinisoli TaxID=2589080 RepID=A0A4Y5Z5L0_9GAMM|nr:hypothetical protein [Luteibacter pinisoli]QDE40722.1 hypothetical protein FIV34_16660 [Luteibacter pinisoli]
MHPDKHLRRFAALVAWIGAAASAHAAVAANATLAAIEAADQADRAAGSNAIDWAVVGKRDASRRAQVMRLLQAGHVRTADDYLNAAVVFQHGEDVADTRLALALATTASRIDPANKDAGVLAAQAWDRILVKSGRPQWYGTQFARDKATGRWAISPVEAGVVSEPQREAMGLPTLAQTQAHLDAMNARK